MPREFAEAYQAAYEAALAAQAELKPGAHAERSVGRRWRVHFETGHGRPSSGTPRPDERPSSGSGVPAESPLLEDPREPTGFERVRDSVWFVPVLLMALVALMLIGAYVLGRVFAAHVGT